MCCCCWCWCFVSRLLACANSPFYFRPWQKVAHRFCILCACCMPRYLPNWILVSVVLACIVLCNICIVIGKLNGCCNNAFRRIAPPFSGTASTITKKYVLLYRCDGTESERERKRERCILGVIRGCWLLAISCRTPQKWPFYLLVPFILSLAGNNCRMGPQSPV